jgi:predicted MFS family arabinose efflux permease
MGRALFVIAGGVIAAAQIGKAIVALPLLRAEFGLGLDAAGWILALFALLGATLAFPAAIAAGRFGARRSLIAGLATIAIGSALGAAAPSPAALLATRLVEGAGFLGVILVAPGLIARLAPPDRRKAAMAGWGAFMGAGAVLALLAGPALPTIGWRGLWLGLAAAAALHAGLARLALPPDEAGTGAAASLGQAGAALASPACLRLAVTFMVYAALYFALAGFLPELLVGRLGMSHAAASLVAAGAIAANAAGNLLASWLIGRGVAPATAMAWAFAAFALAAWPALAGASPPAALLAAFLALGIGGLCPASIFASLPGAAPRGALIPATGLLMQASHIGQFAGPAAAGFVIERWGWPALAAPMIFVAGAGMALALARRGV